MRFPPFILYGLGEVLIAQKQAKQLQEEAKVKAEIARTLYWEACKYPRKKKKFLRKKARENFELYSILSQPFNFSW